MTRSSILLLSAFLILGGCSSAHIHTGGPVPPDADNFSIEVIPFNGNTWNKPLGSHHIEGSEFFVFKKSGAAGPGLLLFGPLGIAMVHAGVGSVNAGYIEGNEDGFAMTKMQDYTKELLQKDYSDEVKALQGGANPKAKMEFMSYGSIEIKEDRAFITYITDVELLIESFGEKKLWQNHYCYLSPHESIESLFSSDSTTLQEDIEKGLSENIASFFDDMADRKNIEIQTKTSKYHMFLNACANPFE